MHFHELSQKYDVLQCHIMNHILTCVIHISEFWSLRNIRGLEL
jgi:hypothetical protein